MEKEKWVEVAWDDIKVGDTLQWWCSDAWMTTDTGVVADLLPDNDASIRVVINDDSFSSLWGKRHRYRKLIKEEELNWIEVAWDDIKIGDTLQWQSIDGGWSTGLTGVAADVNSEGLLKVRVQGFPAYWSSDFKYRKLVVVEETPDLGAQIDVVFTEIKAMLLERAKTKATAKRAPIEGGCEYCDSVVPEFCGSCPFCGKR